MAGRRISQSRYVLCPVWKAPARYRITQFAFSGFVAVETGAEEAVVEEVKVCYWEIIPKGCRWESAF